MKLEQIHLKNFGSYREASIDLRRIAQAVVLGQNGAGKSTAFIDAVLAGLYGKARSSMDDMIMTGETDMMVSVIFSLAGQRYRVIRKRSVRTKAGKSDLELQVQQGGQTEETGTVDVEWTPISGGRLNETQEKIIQLLNCDQDLLTATAFFLQGQADRFSRATPSERKTILASILRLDLYAILKQAASRAASRIEDRKTVKATQLNDLQATENQLVDERAWIQALAQQQQDAVEAYRALDAAHAQHLEQRATLQGRMDSLSTITEQCSLNLTKLPRLRQQEQELLERHGRMEEAKAKQAVVDHDRLTITHLEELLARLAETREQLLRDRASLENQAITANSLTAELDGRRAEQRAAQPRIQQLQEKMGRWEKILQNRQTIEAKVQEHADATRAMVEIEEEQADRERLISSATEYLLDARANQSRIQTIETTMAVIQLDLEKTVAAYHIQTANIAREIEYDREQARLLGQVPCDPVLQGRCQFTRNAVEAQARIPRQQQALDARLKSDADIIAAQRPDLAERRVQMTAELEAFRLVDWAERIATGQRKRDAIQAQAQLGRVAIETHRTSMKALERFTVLVPELELAAREIPAVCKDLDDAITAQDIAQKNISSLEAKLLDLQGVQQGLASLLVALTENERARADTATRIQSLTLSIGQITEQISTAERDLPVVARDLARVIEERASLEQIIKAQELELMGIDDIQAEIDQTLARLRHVESCQADNVRDQARLSEAIGKRKATVEQAEQRVAAGAELRLEIETMERDLRQYRSLAEAYAMIPTLVLENALPILEYEANTILGKVSRTGMRVRFDTQKALKSRDGLAETLDIAVRDQAGERPLENYSGGERFRLDLAIRIGLSKLLARRAGSKIETLVIDEGLGSLDEDGLNQLRECLTALGDDFKQILVITHVDAMKATFPSQIMVTKDQRGSQVEVLG
ncbi:MAG: Exonuclease SbcC [Nitrospira sp.]|nr:MAG: Exonuclease SbcC [Nitrospira sp.]